MFTPKRSSVKRSRLSLASPRQSPSVGRVGGGSTVPVHISELLKESVDGANVLNDGWACVAANETLYCWKMNQKSTSFKLSTPLDSNSTAKNFTIIDSSACFISISGIGRFWPSYSDATRWLDFKVTVEAGEIVQAVHSSKDRIVAVTSKGGLVGVTLSNGGVQTKIHRNQKQGGLVSRMSSYIWSSNETYERPPISSMVNDLVLLYHKEEVQLWDIYGEQGRLRQSAPKSELVDEDVDEVVSLTGNSKYLGFLVSFGEKMKLKVLSVNDFISGTFEFNSKIINLPVNDKAVAVMPYMTESSVVSVGRLWLGEDSDIERLDELLTIGSFDGKVVVLTKRGLIMRNTSQKLNTETLSESMIGRSKSFTDELGSIESMEQMAGSDNPKFRLQAGFLQYARGNVTEAQQLLATVGDLESTAVQLSHDFINEIPTHDPRWSDGARSQPQGKSLIIQKQIAEKVSTHQVFRNFVASSIAEDSLALIAQDAEKLAVAMAIRSSPATLQNVISTAIQIVLSQKGSSIPQALTAQDIFFAKVSEIGDIVGAFVHFIEDSAGKSAQRQVNVQELDLIHHANQAICTVINAISKFRQENSYLYCETARYWTNSLQDFLITATTISGQEKFSEQRSSVIEQLFTMSKFVLNDRFTHLKVQAVNLSLEAEKQFKILRGQLIKLFADRARWTEVGLLSEQFQDFDGLIHVYKATGNKKDFARHLLIPGFPDFVKTQYVGKDLVDIAVEFGGDIAELVREDKNHGWMLMIQENRFNEAGESLVAQAKEVDASLNRRTLLSLAKLASIAGGAVAPDNTNITKEEKLLDFQDALPDPSQRVNNTAPALDAYEIIENLTNQYLRPLTIADAKNALQVYDLAEPSEKTELNSLIWARVIASEMDSPCWKRALENAHQPQEAIMGTKLDQLLEFCTNSEQLPLASEVINHPELCNYADQPIMSYILSASVEAHAERLDGMES